MNITKKIVSLLLIFILFFINNISFANGNNNIKKIDKYKNELLSIKKGGLYLIQINKFVKKVNKKQSAKIVAKINILEKKLELKNDRKSKTLKILLSYLKESLIIKFQINTPKIEKNISEIDKEYIEKEILKIQGNILNSTKSVLEKFSSDLSKITQYEEKGDLKISFDLNYDEIGQINTEAELKNYTIKNNLLDNNFNTEFNLNINSKLKNDLEKKLKISSKLDYIQKDGLEYLLINKLEILDNKGFENIQKYLDILVKLVKENKYIEIENNKIDKNIIKNIKNFNPKNILRDSQNILSKPFLEAYNKTGNKYYLKPTKYACDKIKEISNKFDPINGKECSTSQYNDLLEEVSKYGNLYMIVDNEQKELIYEYKKTTKLDSGIISIKFNNKNIISTYINITPNQTRYKNEGFTFSYKDKKELNIKFNANSGKTNILLESKLNSYNSFKEIELAINNKQTRNEFRLGFVLKNNNIKGNLDYITNSYNWKNDNYSQNTIFNANISGTRNNWKFNANSKDIKSQTVTLNSNLKYINGLLVGETIVNQIDKKIILKVEHNGKINIKYFELNNKIILNEKIVKEMLNGKSKSRDSIRIWNLKTIQSALEQYYSDNSEYPITIVGNKDLEDYLGRIPKDPLKNIEINGCKFGYYYEIGADDNGISNQSFKLSSCLENESRAKNDNGIDDKKFEIISGKIKKINKAFYINGYKTWDKQKMSTKKYNLVENINIKIDSKNNKNNFYLLINALLNSKEILKFEMKNSSKRTYKRINIIKPENTLKLEEALK